MRRILGLGAALAAGIATCVASTHAETLRLGAAVPGGQAVEFDVFMPLHNQAQLEALLKAQVDPKSHYYHQWLTPASFAARFGPSAAAMQEIAKTLEKRGLAVQIHSRSLHISGTAATIGTAFGTSFVQGTSASGSHYLVASKALSLPQAAVDAGAMVFAFQPEVTEKHVDSRRVPGVAIPGNVPFNRYSYTGGYFFDDLKQAYSYPSYQTKVMVNGKQQRLDGTGTTIGILMSSDIIDNDITSMFTHENFSQLAGVPTPGIYAKVKVNGGAGFGDEDSLGEASLDTQQAIGGAPGAHLILYEIPSLADEGILAGYATIVEANTADVVSSSFGGCELFYTAAYSPYTYKQQQQYLKVQHEIFEQGNAQGITFLASSGDSSGLGCPSVPYLHGSPGTFLAGIESPADDINVTAVGGTNLVTNMTVYSLDSTYIEENAWSDPEVPYDPYGLGQNVTGGVWGAGGGLSVLFPKPAYQSLVDTGTTTVRTTPDIGMQVGGCPGGISELPCDGGNTAIDGSGNTLRSYVYISVDGTFYGVIGTSVSSPELAGATALLVEVNGRMGNINPYIYQSAATENTDGAVPTAATTLFNVGIPGYNGVVENGTLGAAYNYTTGVGTPLVYRYVGVPNATPAGVPQTASNP